jgi:hypothetical protein
VLTEAGVKCGHEQVFDFRSLHGQAEWGDLQGDSSWMATAWLPMEVPTALLVRHPLAVVKSWVEIGFFTHQPDNPCHLVSQAMCPQIYDEPTPADSALGLWLHCTRTALRQAELVLRLERLDEALVGRLLSWAGGDPSLAGAAMARVGEGVEFRNEHLALKARSGVFWEPDWSLHRPELAEQAMDLAERLGYDPAVIP